MIDVKMASMDRRTALKWMLAVAASVPLARQRLLAGDPIPGAGPSGYGSGPELNKTYAPGEIWPLTLTGAQRRTVQALCDTIIPADDGSPAASAVGVVDFFDEWVSAPYPRQRADRPVLTEGLAWIDAEAQRRFGRDFAALDESGRAAICDDICLVSAAKADHRQAAAFFARFRDLTAGAFSTTPAGMKDIGYVGNVPLANFDGPPEAALRHVGLI